MKWHIVVVLALAVGSLVVVAACTTVVPALRVECEAGATESFGLWCKQHPLPPSALTPTPEPSGYRPIPARRSSSELGG